VTIDPDALDVEWLRQPQLMIKYAKISAEAKMEVLSAKENLDLVRAELDKDIRSDPDKFGIAKITESAVLNTIISNQRYKKANSEYLEKQYEYEMSRGEFRHSNIKKMLWKTWFVYLVSNILQGQMYRGISLLNGREALEAKNLTRLFTQKWRGKNELVLVDIDNTGGRNCTSVCSLFC